MIEIDGFRAEIDTVESMKPQTAGFLSRMLVFRCYFLIRKSEYTYMRWGPLLLCGWPGLTGLWYRGQLSSLLVAVGFSILLNLALVSSFLWPWALGETFPAVAWPMILLIWGTSGWLAYHRLTDVMSVPSSEKVAVPERPDTLFIQAQREYLGGHWEEAETLLRLRIGRAPRDVEARLLLTTLLRHTRRLDESHEQLEEMLRFDESQEWEFEIDRERQLIDLIAQHEVAEQEMDPNEEDLNDELPPNNDGFVRELKPPAEPTSTGQLAIDSN